jgi:hypothetical protein
MQLDQHEQSKSKEKVELSEKNADPDMFKDYFYMDSVERYNVKYRPRDTTYRGQDKVQIK